MDTNLKNTFRKSAFTTILMILIFTIISVASYKPLKDQVLSKEVMVKNYIESDNFNWTLATLTNKFKRAMIEENHEFYHNYKKSKIFKYHVFNNDNNLSQTNIEDFTKSKISEYKKSSQFFLQMKLDQKGYCKIEDLKGFGFDQMHFINRLNLRYETTIANEDEAIELKPQLDIIYMIPENSIIPVDFLNSQDQFVRNIKIFNIKFHMMLIIGIGILSFLILSIFAFFIPYKMQKEISICKVSSKLFLEIKILLRLGFILGVIGFIAFLNNNFDFDTFISLIYDSNEYFYVIGIPIAFIGYLLWYLDMVYIKYIYHIGLGKVLRENSVFMKICPIFFIKVKKSFDDLVKIDIRENSHKKIITILILNLIILCMIALLGAYSLIIIGFYIIFLFKYLVKILSKIETLESKSKRLAEGNFDIIFEEDLGIFNPISENLNHIKEGFKVSIDEELKSQRMKTELISNVSHDLKTPLTSIITYADLLKNEDISSEVRQEYVNVLNKKSKRLKILIDDLFEASKANSGNIELQLERLNVIALFRQTFGELEEKINESNLEMKINIPENKIFCNLDGRITYRIFENIMSNIFKYAMEHSRVYIDVLENEKEISFVFKNMSAYEMNFDASQITERFTRGDVSRTTEGSGLGLAITKSLLELQDGRLEIIIDGDLFKVVVVFLKDEKN